MSDEILREKNVCICWQTVKHWITERIRNSMEGKGERERETERGLSPELLVPGVSSLCPAPVYLTITSFTHPLPGGNSLGSLVCATKQGSLS